MYFEEKTFKDLANRLEKAAQEKARQQEEFKDYINKKLNQYLKVIRGRARTGVPVDTGTLQKRIDYQMESWNNIVAGIFEPQDKYSGEPASPYYDTSKHLHPEKRHRYKKYAAYWIPQGNWGNVSFNNLESLLNKQIKKIMKEFFEGRDS